MSALETIDRAVRFRHLGAAARIATMQPITADAARALEFAPAPLMSGFGRLEDEIARYLDTVAMFRLELGRRCAL